MAFENHIIASMNNPTAVAAWREANAAWREANRQHFWKHYHAGRAANLEEHIDVLHANASHANRILENVQHELQASCDEILALRKDLDEAYKVSQSALTLASTYSEAYFEQRVRACKAERLAFDYGMFAFALVAMQSLGVWIGLLAWLP